MVPAMPTQTQVTSGTPLHDDRVLLVMHTSRHLSVPRRLSVMLSP